MNAASLAAYYRDRRVLVTGHTGFKGAWLALALAELGARVTGLALPPDDDGIYQLGDVGRRLDSRIVDIRDAAGVAAVVRETEPEVVFHLAAQALVPDSFRDPVSTFHVNVVGTAAVLVACTDVDSVAVVVAVTSDKVYANDGRGRPFVESDALGGGDPYSASKAATEMVVSSWRHSFLAGHPAQFRLASARAGNVVGGGDRARDRIVPDLMAALRVAAPVRLRNPEAIRPWQFVLEPIAGYLTYAAELGRSRSSIPDALNFGPDASSACSVADLTERLIAAWGAGSWEPTDVRPGPEAGVLLLDSAEAQRSLGWRCLLDLDDVVRLTVDWYRSASGGDATAVAARSVDQLHEYLARLDREHAGSGSS